MSGGTDRHPAPHADKLSIGQAFFMLFAGPIAWFVQVCGSAILLGWPCFPAADRFLHPMPNYAWTRSGAIALLVICTLIALVAGLTSARKLREVKDEKEGGHKDLIEVGHGRTRFTAMWGVILGFGFAIACLLTIVPFLMVARCVG